MSAFSRVVRPLALCSALAAGGVLHGQTYVQWLSGSGGNNHYYQLVLVPAGLTWTVADSAAQTAGGYLATLTSANESSFVFTNVASTQSSAWFTDTAGNGEGPWLGGFQPNGSSEPSGGWTWVTGETWSYTNWASGEPSNGNGGEDKLVFFGHGNLMGNAWNDVPPTSTMNSYIIEFNTSPIPEPATAAMLLGLGAIAVVTARRKYLRA